MNSNFQDRPLSPTAIWLDTDYLRTLAISRALQYFCHQQQRQRKTVDLHCRSTLYPLLRYALIFENIFPWESEVPADVRLRYETFIVPDHDLVSPASFSDKLHISEKYMRLFDLKQELQDTRPFLQFPFDRVIFYRAEDRAKFTEARNTGIGTVAHFTPQLPDYFYDEWKLLFDHMIQSLNIAVTVLCEEQYANFFADKFYNCRILKIGSIWEIAEQLLIARLFCGNHSFIAELAAALRIPSFILYPLDLPFAYYQHRQPYMFYGVKKAVDLSSEYLFRNILPAYHYNSGGR